jgi:hypothetical protein
MMIAVLCLRFFFSWRNKQADASQTVIEGNPDFHYQL